jgi:serine/alanine racemase
LTQAQLDRFEQLLSKIRAQGHTLPKLHAQNSYGVFSRPDLPYDFARVGIALYGGVQNTNGAVQCGELRPVLSVRARVVLVRAVQAGCAIGYGPSFVAPRDMKIAVLSIGYADGIRRALSNGTGHVLINGAAAPVVGMVCMDQMTADVTDAGDVKRGDIATIIGRQGGREIFASELAKHAGTIPNEIMGRLGQRLERFVV